MDRQRAHELKRILRHHAIQYYDLDSPEISDEAYDLLEAEYKQITGEHFVYMGTFHEALTPVTHTTPIKSLEKINTLEQCREHLMRLAPGIIEPKYDGLTVMIYPSGVMATRGSGAIGEDITHTASKFIKSPQCEDSRFNRPVRGEAFLLLSHFDKINAVRQTNGKEPYKNPRNAMAGMLRNKYADEVWPNSQFVAYNLVGSSLSETEQLQTLANIYDTPCTHSFKYSKETIGEAIDFIRNFDREGLDFEVDGLVIKSDIRNADEIFGGTSHHPKNAVAYKFPAQGKWTTLKNIEWTVGRTGKVVPNAVFEPVELLNTTVSNSTLHNASYMDNLRLTENCEIFVIKSNDVIPGVIEARNNDGVPYKEPSECPSCSANLSRKDSSDNEGVYQLYCENPLCDSRMVERLIHLCKKENLDIEGVQVATATKLLDHLIEYPTDIFTLSKEDIEFKLPGFSNRSAENLYNSIQKATRIPLQRFLSSVGIPLVGQHVSKDLAEHFGTYEKLRNDIVNRNCSGLSHIPGIGETIVRSIENNFELWDELLVFVTPQPFVARKIVSNELTFVITGAFQDQNGVKVNRKELEKKVTDAGHKITGSVSRKTDYVIVGEKAGSKATKATELGITIIEDLEEFYSLLK